MGVRIYVVYRVEQAGETQECEYRIPRGWGWPIECVNIYSVFNMSYIVLSQSIKSIKILKEPHEKKRIHIPAQPHGQQTPRREATQASGLRASRASVSLRDSLYVYTLFTEARAKTAEENPPGVSSS